MKISISVVSFHSPQEDIKALIKSVRSIPLEFNFEIVDNAGDELLKKLCQKEEVSYRACNNIGFGAAHNLVLKEKLGKADYHLVLNPDVYFEGKNIAYLVDQMNNNPQLGLGAPQIRYPDDSIQHLCKLLPSPTDLISRRFLPEKLSPYNADAYEMKQFDYNKNIIAPVLSGCCMLLRDESLRKCGLFDERFFLYLEDVDLSRRIFQKFDNMHFSEVHIYHKYQKSSYHNQKSARLHIQSAMAYFNKWGWWNDPERKALNERALKETHSLQAR